MRVRCFPVLVTTIAFCAITAAARAETPTIYKWVDENGIAHYTTNQSRIPSAIRDRVESIAAKPPASAAPAAGQPSREDVMRDAVRTRPTPAAEAESVAMRAPSAPPPSVETIAAPNAAATPIPPDTESATEATSEAETIEIASPAPIAPDLREESSAVSAPPPAAPIELEPKQQVAVDELDQQIEGVQAEIAQREDTLAALISTSDEQRTTPLVDDPAFREISQRLPKLQADLQTLRERRNKIQPTAPTP